MSDPIRIQYSSHQVVPPTAGLLTHVRRGKHVVLEFPPDYDCDSINSLLSRVSEEAPENYITFNAGAFRDKTCVSIMEVVSRSSILEMENDLVSAALHFRDTATLLITDLAKHNRVSRDRIWDECGDLESHSSEWKLYVHGQHCCFTHRDTRQTVEVSMWFAPEFGVLDPYFFFDYMKTTPEIQLPSDLREGFHDTCRAIEVLESRGKLFRVQGIFNSSGLTAASQNY